MNDTPESLKNEKLFLSKLVEQVADKRLHGSFSERNPQLGPMRTCPLCHARFRFALGHSCAAYATTQRAWTEELGFFQTPCPLRINENATPRAKGRKNSHTHANGQPHPGPLNTIHQVTLEWQRNAAVMHDALNAMQFGITDAMLKPDTDEIKPQLIPTLAEKFVLWKLRTKRRFARCQRDVARRVNLGLLPGGSRA